jgi:hypothetical protein
MELFMKKLTTILGASILLAAGSVSAEGLDKVTYDVGAGANYGGIGAVVNYAATDDLEVFAGGGLGYVAGVKYYLSDNTRISVNYGTNAILVNSSVTSIDKKFQGVNIGVGYISDRNGGWSADLMYIDTSSAESYMAANNGYTLNGGKVKLSFGYRW